MARRPERQLSGRKCKSSRAGKRGQLAHCCFCTLSLLSKPPSWLPYWQVWTGKGCLWRQVKTSPLASLSRHRLCAGSSRTEPGGLRVGLPGWRAWGPWRSLAREERWDCLHSHTLEIPQNLIGAMRACIAQRVQEGGPLSGRGRGSFHLSSSKTRWCPFLESALGAPNFNLRSLGSLVSGD